MPSPWVWALAEDGDGSVWIGTELGLARFAGGRIERVSSGTGLPATMVTALAVGPRGALYVGTDRGPRPRSSSKR